MNNKYIFFSDPRRCIGCGTCLAACMMNHDTIDGFLVPRMALVKTKTFSAPIGCRHCVDAPCITACPADALYREGEIVMAKSDKCIGCGSCVVACPFGAIDVIETSGAMNVTDRVFSLGGKMEVLKCDLCVGKESGPSCIKACLTDALVYIDEDVIKESIKNKRITAAESASASSIGAI